MSEGSYDAALRAAGVTVHECRWFGSYQGEWLAHVTMPDGRTGFIKGYYGSCSGCDAFEAEMGYDYHQYDTHKGVDFLEGCDKCAEHKAQLKTFGEGYLSDFKTPEEMAEQYIGESYWSTYSETAEQAQMVMAHLADDSEIKAKLLARINRPDSDA